LIRNFKTNPRASALTAGACGSGRRGHHHSRR